MPSRTYALDRVPGVRFRAAAGGWLVAAEPLPASRAAEIPALREVAVMVGRGVMRPTMPVIIAVKELGGGLPPLVFAQPLEDAEVADWLRGDRGLAQDVALALQQEYDALVAQARAGKAT